MSIDTATPVGAGALAAFLPVLGPHLGVGSHIAAAGPSPVTDSGLADLGWATSAGVTAMGRDLVRELIDAPAVTVRAEDAAGSDLTRILVGPRSLLVVDVRSTDASAADPGVVAVRRVPASALPLVLGRLAGLRPTPVVEGDAVELDQAVVDARVAAVATPVPADAPSWLRAAWPQPWRRWRVDVDDGPHLHHIDTGATGQLEVRPRGGGRVALAIRPEGLVWGDLQAIPGRLLPAGGFDPDAAEW